MAILEEENIALRKRVLEFAEELRRLKETYAHVTAENTRLRERVRALEAQQTPGAEGRAYPRVPTALRVDIANRRGAIALGVIRDLSQGGALIETDMPLIPGDVITVAFELLLQPFKLQAEVMRSLETGLGIKFAADAGQQERLRRYLAQI